MKYFYPFIVLAIVFLASCQTVPSINPPLFSAFEKDLTCPSPFLKEKYQLIYAIEIRAAGDTQGAVIGITVADPFTRFVSCAIMTAEGMVLFDAEAGPDMFKVNRALPPFDSADFAKNMIEDIKLIFFAPEGKIQTKGNLPDGATICRYREKNDDWIDVTANHLAGTVIKRYSSFGILKRQVKFNKMAGNIYQNIELQGNALANYTLIMNLIDAQRVEDELTGKKK